MSDERYAPPTAALAEPTQGRGTGEIDLGEAFREAWAAVWPNFGLIIGTGLLGGLIALLSGLTIVGIIAVWPVLAWGSTRFLLNVLDGDAETRDLFAGFSNYGENLRAMLNLGGLMLLIALAGQALSHLGTFLGSTVVMVLGGLVSLYWSLCVMPRLAFVGYYLVDQGLGASESIRASWDATQNQKLMCFVLGLVSGLIPLVGFLFLIVGVIPAVMVASLMQAAAYRQLAGR